MQTLKEGSGGPQTELLQLALTRAGFEPDCGIDGIFSPSVSRALKEFQSAHGITPTGIAGSITQKALEPWLTGYTVHAVKPGDTMLSVATRYGTSLQAVEVANPEADLFCLDMGRKLIIPLNFSIVPVNVSFTSELLEYCIRGLTVRYKFLKRGVIGQSVLGRKIHLLEIGNGDKKVFYNASHHAEEWISSALLMKFVEDYADTYSKNEKIFGVSARRLFKETTLSVVPMVNPDGVDLATGAFSPDDAAYRNALRMSNPEIPFPRNWRANINGVDLNLQYPAGWEKARDLKRAAGFTSPGPRDYPGSHPLSEPESRSVLDFSVKRRFDMAVALHTQGRVIYWKYMDCEPPGAREIGEEFAAVSGYELDDAPAFSAHAGYKDWFIQHFRKPAFTVEAGLGTNPLPVSDFQLIYRELIGILTYGLM